MCLRIQQVKVKFQYLENQLHPFFQAFQVGQVFQGSLEGPARCLRVGL